MRESASRRREREAAERAVAAWNATYRVGQRARFWKGERRGEPSGEGEIYNEATVLGGHTAVAWIEGARGCVALSHVEVIVEAPANTTDAPEPCGCRVTEGEDLELCDRHQREYFACGCSDDGGAVAFCDAHAREYFPDVIVDIEAPAAAEGGGR